MFTLPSWWPRRSKKAMASSATESDTAGASAREILRKVCNATGLVVNSKATPHAPFGDWLMAFKLTHPDYHMRFELLIDPEFREVTLVSETDQVRRLTILWEFPERDGTALKKFVVATQAHVRSQHPEY